MDAVKLTKRVKYPPGYDVALNGAVIGLVQRHFPTWERRTPGRVYVNARGTCKRAEWWPRVAGQSVDRLGNYRTRAGAVQALVDVVTDHG